MILSLKLHRIKEHLHAQGGCESRSTLKDMTCGMTWHVVKLFNVSVSKMSNTQQILI